MKIETKMGGLLEKIFGGSGRECRTRPKDRAQWR